MRWFSETGEGWKDLSLPMTRVQKEGLRTPRETEQNPLFYSSHSLDRMVSLFNPEQRGVVLRFREKQGLFQTVSWFVCINEFSIDLLPRPWIGVQTSLRSEGVAETRDDVGRGQGVRGSRPTVERFPSGLPGDPFEFYDDPDPLLVPPQVSVVSKERVGQRTRCIVRGSGNPFLHPRCR